MFERMRPDQIAPPLFEKRLLRSYTHFAVWSAFASGHAGIPLKWCDGLTFGEMFPRGTGPFSAQVYPDLAEETKPLQELLAQVDISKLTERQSYDVIMPDGIRAPFTYCRALKSEETIVAWIFDDDFDRDQNWGVSLRTYMEGAAESKSNLSLRVTGLRQNAQYSVRWFNTWEGGFYHQLEAPLTTGTTTEIQFPLGGLSSTSKAPGEAWDGADTIFVIRRVQ
ncbi:MAG: hypothetical protein HYU36_25290 [Planctomycetes bacterium]|nr:hypothetical protein [Planctomycetota bacterium]